MAHKFITALIVLSGLLIVACSDSSAPSTQSAADDSTAAPPVATQETAPEPVSQAFAARFLTQATFGPSLKSIEEFRSMEPEEWLEQQFSLPPTLHLDHLVLLPGEKRPDNRIDA